MLKTKEFLVFLFVFAGFEILIIVQELVAGLNQKLKLKFFFSNILLLSLFLVVARQQSKQQLLLE